MNEDKINYYKRNYKLLIDMEYAKLNKLNNKDNKSTKLIKQKKDIINNINYYKNKLSEVKGYEQ